MSRSGLPNIPLPGSHLCCGNDNRYHEATVSIWRLSSPFCAEVLLFGGKSKLLFKNRLQGPIFSIILILLKQFDQAIHQLTQCFKAGIDLFFCTAIDDLLALLVHYLGDERQLAFRETALVDIFFVIFDEHPKRFVYKLVTTVPAYIAAYQLAVHAYLFAADIELQNLISGNVLHALLEQIYIVFPVVLRYSLAER